ncbi:DUF1294 domain-containing protein [Mucisphaera calidilacus]|uniref:DUF1294 domain-containing protein n=1 Tax=Mucisphaera calidilacus TaxID=2527982 RepID=A0A518C049_9BACT|nr:DUF1294 domain-containing protein [Mucisphaera calidilacus]QDU72593.1 hypothetical protein Pan265_24630 [Mucisphaera calidilacus]
MTLPLEAVIYAALLAVMSLITFLTYALDKRAATRQQFRTPEATLHLLELLGGYPGGLLARRYLRHKSAKLSFRIVSWTIILIHAALIIAWVTWRFAPATTA